MTREEIIRAAVSAYPDGDVLVDTSDVAALIKRVKTVDVGDTLLSFVILELAEGLDITISANRSIHLMEHAVSELQGVIAALEKLR